MKTSRDRINKENKQGMSKKPRPEIRDNLDSRKEEEQDFKGDDVTHNTKYEKSGKQKKKTKD
ncbi:MAG TPA: hypothetical protein VN958_10485 [Chitinophagaceae bacterium]|nr:hypothetical protein [Chitinophagaceae bacterium]